MTQYNDVDSALNDIPGATSLWIDFSKGQHLTESIGDLSELTTLDLRECPRDLVLPQSLRKLEKLKKLSMTGANDDLLIPALVPELDLDRLDVWDCDVKQLESFTRLRELYVVVKDAKEDVRFLSRALPQLVQLEVWGGHLKDGELPGEIERFTDLEVLHLVSCGIKDLPPEMTGLAKLRELRLRGLPMRTLPEVVCELGALQTLEIGVQINGLPAGMSKLKQLRGLSLQSALNQGAMLSRFDHEHLGRMKPLPRVLSELTWLTNLELDCCGVVSSEPLRSLVNLTSLSLTWAAIPTCEDIAMLTSLEELNLEHNDYIRDFTPLSALKRLKKLDMVDTRPKSLDFLKELPLLEELNVKSVKCKDMKALYDLSLTNLKASDEVLEKWKKRMQLGNLPSAEDIRERLASDDLPTVERALQDLSSYVEAASSRDQNALPDVFGLGRLKPLDDEELDDDDGDDDDGDETEDEEEHGEDDEVVSEEGQVYGSRHIPLLDQVLSQHRNHLSSDTLIKVFSASLQSVYNDYACALKVVEELIRRKEIAAQLAVVEVFKKACEYYDAGHREWGDTVQDQLIETYFPDFESEPLAHLLEWCRNDHLNREGGDCMDALFAPALACAPHAELFDRVIKRLERYAREQMEYGNISQVDELLAEIRGVVPAGYTSVYADFQNRLDAEFAASRKRAQVGADAGSGDAGRVQAAIEQIDNLSEEDWRDIQSKFWYCFGTEGLSWTARRRLLDKFMETEDEYGVIRAITNLAQEDLTRLRAELASVEKVRLATYLREVLLDALKPRRRSELQSSFPSGGLRGWACELDSISDEQWRKTEVVAMFKVAFKDNDSEELERAVVALAELPDGIDLTEEDRTYGGTYGDRLADLVVDCVTYAEAELMKLARQIHRIHLKDGSLQRILAQLVGVAINEQDDEALEALQKRMPQDLTSPILAYNLACNAARREDRPGLFNYTKLALDLGKSPTQFREDSDFAPYLEDQEFVDLLDSVL